MRRLVTFERMVASIASSALLLALAAGGTGCTLGVADDDDDDDVTDTPPPPPPPPPPIPTPGKYTRGSLVPLFQLTPAVDQNRITPFGIALQNADFITPGESFLSVDSKLKEIEQQIEAERGEDVNIYINPSDSIRAEEIPFRGNPNELAVEIGNDGIRKVLVTLGGDIGTPGNEVAIVDPLTEDVNRVKVGIKPQAIACHPDAGICFVANQYSNYISVLDVAQEAVLTNINGDPVEIPTEYYASDILLAEKVIGGDFDDRFHLVIANEWRGAVLRYDIALVRDFDNRVIDVVIENPKDPISQPQNYIVGAGPNPVKLKLDDQQENVYVVNGRGGDVALVDLSSSSVIRTFNIGASSEDIVNIDQSVFVPTVQRDRGYLADNEVTPEDAQADPIVIQGVTGESVQAHPGAFFDRTLAYNFDDLRNQTVQLDRNLSGEQVDYVDDTSPEVNFDQAQKVLSGATPVSVERNFAGDKIFLANAGDDTIQELDVGGGQGFRLTAQQGANFETGARPVAMVVDEADDVDQLLVAVWGQDTLEIFDLNGRNLLQQIDLGYAEIGTGAEYPANNIEIGENLYYSAVWSNDGNKACTSCHGPGNMISDGLPYANGATAPTAPHGVRPNWNLMTTDAYFWNGSFNNGSYASLAFAAQTRTVCEQIVFATVEGPSTPANQRQGDPAATARGFGAADPNCQPDAFDQTTGLPQNFGVAGQAGTIADTIAQQKADAENAIVGFAQTLGSLAAVNLQARADVSRFSDYYSVSELRLPPNPLQRLLEVGDLSSEDAAKINRGGEIFAQAGCGNCHNPANSRSPYTDGLQHGRGSDWNRRFIDEYTGDNRVVIPDPIQDVADADSSIPDAEINIHQETDFFKPFCFDAQFCLVFEDPLAVTGQDDEENRRLALIQQINLDDPDRGFVPGNVVGAVRINTPSLRAIWWNAGYLHHSLARTIREATLSPGHPALRPGEIGYAVTSAANGLDFNSHGVTEALTADDMDALDLYVEQIE